MSVGTRTVSGSRSIIPFRVDEIQELAPLEQEYATGDAIELYIKAKVRNSWAADVGTVSPL